MGFVRVRWGQLLLGIGTCLLAGFLGAVPVPALPVVSAPAEVQALSGPHPAAVTLGSGMSARWTVTGGSLLTNDTLGTVQFQAGSDPFVVLRCTVTDNSGSTTAERKVAVLPFVPRDYIADLKTYLATYRTAIDNEIGPAGTPPDSGTFYYTSYYLHGLAAGAEASGDTALMDTLLGFIDRMIAHARPLVVDGITYQQWGEWDENGRPKQLNCFQGMGPLARTAAVIANHPAFRTRYAAKRTQIVAFVDQAIFKYWFDKKVGVYKDPTTTRLGGLIPWLPTTLGGWGSYKFWNDKCSLFGQITAWMSQAAENDDDRALYREYSSRIALGFRLSRQFQQNGNWIWDVGKWPIAQGDNLTGVPDTSHANREPMMVVAMAEAGIEFTQEEIRAMAKTLVNSIWNGDTSDPKFANYIDGQNLAYRTAPPWANGIIYHGWDMVGKYSAEALRVLAITHNRIITRKPSDPAFNPSLGANASSYGRMMLAGTLARNRVGGAAVPVVPVRFVSAGNGAVAGNLNQQVALGESTEAVTAAPHAGYHFVNWTGTGGFVSTVNPLTVVNVTADMTITANFAVNTYTVTFVEGAGGTITGTKVQTVNHGASATAVTAVPGSGYSFVNWTGTGGLVSTTNPLTVSGVTGNLTITANFTQNTPPAIALNHGRLNFAKVGTAVTSAQTLRLRNTGGGTLSWTATPSAGWIVLDRASGTGNARIQVSVNVAGLGNGTYDGTILIADPAATNTPQTVQIQLVVKNAGQNPFGTFETPAAEAVGVTGNIAVTGWVLDDVEVASVKIYRSPLAGEGTARVFIGDANLVEGARPDVEALYATYPWSYRSGWGYMMLTNFLPNGGNGTFTIHIVATDREGRSVTLGTKTITCDNLHATLPFGTIDTPEQGGMTSGSSYVNFGWALTPQPAEVPTNGSTINVWVDGVPVGHPTYDQYRADIATLFPGYANSDGAVGYFYLNPATLTEGAHTIAWSVEDSLSGSTGSVAVISLWNIHPAVRIRARHAVPLHWVLREAVGRKELGQVL